MTSEEWVKGKYPESTAGWNKRLRCYEVLSDPVMGRVLGRSVKDEAWAWDDAREKVELRPERLRDYGP